MRPRHVRTRFLLQLRVEQAVQVELHKREHPSHQPYVLKAIQARLAAYARPNYKKTDYEQRQVWPKIGGRHRMGQKMTSNQAKPDKALFLLGCATIDRAIWVARNGTMEQLGQLVRDPVAFRENLEKLPIYQFDQSALWIKLRGEEGQIVCETECIQDQESRNVEKWRQMANTAEQSQVAEVIRDQILGDMDDRPRQLRGLFAQGGDKFRMTLITNMTLWGWFDPKCQKPTSRPCKYGLIWKCDVLCCLNDITDEDTWARTHSVLMPDGTLHTRVAGTSTKGALRQWVRARRENPDHPFWPGHTVYGQQAAWVCKSMATLFQCHPSQEFPAGVGMPQLNNHQHYPRHQQHSGKPGTLQIRWDLGRRKLLYQPHQGHRQRLIWDHYHISWKNSEHNEMESNPNTRYH